MIFSCIIKENLPNSRKKVYCEVENKNKNEFWHKVTWFCPNCGNETFGYMNKEGMVKGTCDRCKIVMVRINKGKNGETIEIKKMKENKIKPA